MTHDDLLAILFWVLVIHITTIIAFIKKLPDRWLVFKLNIIFAPLGWWCFFLALRDAKKHPNQEKTGVDKFICESCDKTFDNPEKTNKFLKVCCLVLVYGLILFVIESIPTDNMSNILPRFMMDVAFTIIAITHILITLFKDSGRGKCPYCLSEDFVLLDSVKGQNLLKQIKKNKKNLTIKES